MMPVVAGRQSTRHQDIRFYSLVLAAVAHHGLFARVVCARALYGGCRDILPERDILVRFPPRGVCPQQNHQGPMIWRRKASGFKIFDL